MIRKRLCALVVGLLLASSVLAQTQKTFDLKGDTLGESIADYKARHREAKCKAFSDSVTTCSEPNASFAGYTPYVDQLGTGGNAEFFHGRARNFSYEVSTGGSDVDVVAVLTKKYGKPSYEYPLHAQASYRTVEWEDHDSKLKVFITPSKYPNAPTFGSINVTLAYKDQGNDKDI